MTKTGYKNIFIALLLLVFTSQSFAALMMPCHFALKSSNSMDLGDMAGMDHTGMAGMNHADMAGMDHSNMGYSDKTNSASSGDCCKTVGHCNFGGCSLAFFVHPFDFSPLSLHVDVSISYVSTIPEDIASSLFRPPIFC